MLQVPLRVDMVIKKDGEFFDIWCGDAKKPKSIKTPVDPYFYTKKDISFDRASKTTTKAKPLSNCTIERTFFKHTFKTRKVLVDTRNEMTFEDNVPFIIRNRLDKPDFFKKFKMKEELRFLHIDIEQKNYRENK